MMATPVAGVHTDPTDSAQPLALPAAGLPGGGALFEDNKSGGEGAARSEGAEERELQAGREKKEGRGPGGESEGTRERGVERARD